MGMDHKGVFSCCKSLNSIFVKKMREISRGRARNISYYSLQLHQKANILDILYGYFNKLSIDITIV